MGISLNGLTPANTYQSLIKVGDNSQLTATLKTLSDGFGTDLPMQVSTSGVNFTGTVTQNGNPITTNPSGVSGAIQFSDGSAFASDAANLFWDDTNNRLGIGTNAPTATTHIIGVDELSTSTSLLVQNSIGTNILRVHNQSNNSAVEMSSATIANYAIISQNVLQNTQMRFVATTGGIAVNKDYSFAAANTLMHVKGSGSTSATTSLLVQNSAGTQTFKVNDDGSINIGQQSNTNFPYINLSGIYGGLFLNAGDSIVFRSGGSEAMRVNAALSVGIGATSINASAKLQIDSTTKGFLPPRMTTTQKNAISTPASGLMVYDTDTNKLCCYNGTSWNDLF
jgi:hypothetical protein